MKLECGAKIEIQNQMNCVTVVSYCIEDRGHEGRCKLAAHIALAYGVDIYGFLPEPTKPAA